MSIAGFSELSDAELDDIEPWLPKTPGINILISYSVDPLSYFSFQPVLHDCASLNKTFPSFHF